MTTNLFKKAVFFTDIHYGKSSNSLAHNNDCIEFTEWMIKVAKEQGCETCFFLGDYHNNRASVNVHTLNYALKGLELISEAFDQTYFIPGNHDLYWKESRQIQSMEFAKHLPNIVIVNDFFKQGDVSIVPWLIGDDYKKLSKISAQYMLGHFELPSFYMNSFVQMPEHQNGPKREQLAGVGHVFSGHFHKRQTNGNITYMGNCFPHNFSDEGDDDRGIMILEWGKEPVYHAWPNAPAYRIYSLSQILEDPQQFLKPKRHIKVNLDVDISYEEANFIKETFVKQYSLRELTLIPTKNSEHEVDTTGGDIKFETVDAIVMNNINDISSEFFNNQLLLDIYRGL